MNNPFTPNFGQIPNYFAGRQEIISEWMSAFNNIPGDPAQTTLLIGPRGTGKTALLSYFSNEIQSKGWISVNVPCINGMLDDIYSQSVVNTGHIISFESKEQEISINASLPLIGAGLTLKKATNPAETNWRVKMTSIIRQLNAVGTGLLITIDEVNMAIAEMSVFAGYYQMFIREGLKVALIMAGLPHNVSLLLNSETNSFFRRANQKYIGNIPDYEIRDALQKTAGLFGKSINEDALDESVKAINGYPFMFQLVGFRAWAESGERVTIDKNAMNIGISIAKKDLETRILKITLDDISDMGILFLKAMLKDDDYSTLNEISERLGKTKSYVTNYKKKLCEYGVIEDTGRGKYRFALPGLREYLVNYDI